MSSTDHDIHRHDHVDRDNPDRDRDEIEPADLNRDDIDRQDYADRADLDSGPLDELDDRPPPPPAAAAWPRDDVEVSPASVGEPDESGRDVTPGEPVDDLEYEAAAVAPVPPVPTADRTDDDDAWTGAEPTGSPEDPERVSVGQGDDEVTLIDDPEHVRQRWQTVQVGFVDDPRGAMDDAGRLVDEVVELVVTGVAAQRDRLGESWSADDLDTEQLRLALRRYREFLDRLLAV